MRPSSVIPSPGYRSGATVSNYNDGANTGTLRAYRADVNNYFPLSPDSTNAVRTASGNFTVSLPDGGPTQQIPEGASLVVIYRVMSPNFPLKSVVLYNGSVTPTATTGQIPQAVQGFYDAVGGASGTGEVTDIYTGCGGWNNISNSQTLGQSNQYIETLNTGSAYAAVILSTPVNNSDDDGILDAWKAGPPSGDPLEPGLHRREHRIVCAVAGRNARRAGPLCSIRLHVFRPPRRRRHVRFHPAESVPLARCPGQRSTGDGHAGIPQVVECISISNPETRFSKARTRARTADRCSASSPAPHTAPQPGVVAWNGGVELSKIWPANFSACTCEPVDCQLHNPFPVWPEGQLSLRSVRLLSCDTGLEQLVWIVEGNHGQSGTTTSLVTAGLNGACPTRITISGVIANPTSTACTYPTGCDSGLTTIYITTPSNALPNWSYSYGTTA